MHSQNVHGSEHDANKSMSHYKLEIKGAKLVRNILSNIDLKFCKFSILQLHQLKFNMMFLEYSSIRIT